MAQEQDTSQISFLLSDFNTRLRDLEERNRVMRERILLIGQNLISTREELEKELTIVKKQTSEIKLDLEKIKRILESLVTETDKFARKEEIILLEKIIKDFQPLEFVRMKDVEEIIEEKLKKSKSKD